MGVGVVGGSVDALNWLVVGGGWLADRVAAPPSASFVGHPSYRGGCALLGLIDGNSAQIDPRGVPEGRSVKSSIGKCKREADWWCVGGGLIF